MEFTLQNVGIIRKSTINLDGLTVICGSNNSGKSTIGKAVYATIESLSKLEEKLHLELLANYRRVLLSVSRILDLGSISRYVDFSKIKEVYGKDYLGLVDSPLVYGQIKELDDVIGAYVSLKDAIESLSPSMLMAFTIKSKSDLPKKFFAYLQNLEENRKRALSLLAKLNKYFFEEDLQGFAEKNVAELFSREFKGQIYPVNLKGKEKKSSVSMSQNEEIGCSLSIFEKKEITATVNGRKLFLSNAVYIDDPYVLDKITMDDEYSILYRLDGRIIDYSHYAKLRKLLMKKDPDSLIEKSINKESYDDIISKINNVIPGVLAIKDSGMYYEETNKEPLKVQNLATGSKMFSIVKNLIQKGEINFDTMLILDEPEAHLHPEWQNVFAEVIVLLVKELDAHVLLTTHSPNFLMAIEAFSKKYELTNRANYYMAEICSDRYMVDYICVNDRVSQIYSSFTLPLVKVKQLKDE